MKKFYGIIVLLLLLLTHELMVHTEARNCYSRSRVYHGRCFFRNHRINCKAMCKEEQFTAGRCIRGTCYCSKTCGIGGGVPTHQSHPPPHPHPPPPANTSGGGGGGGEDTGNEGPPADGSNDNGAEGGDAPPSLLN
ncbi:hypothetical protein ABFS82_10G124600 [Erythranthe guttata]